MDIGEQVYETLLNVLEIESELSWVTPIFVPGHPCFETYCDMHAAYERLRQRLHVTEEDADVEGIIDCLLKQGKLLALEMFHYGYLYRDMEKGEKKPGA